MTRPQHRMTTFFRCRSAIVKGKMKRGIFKELSVELGFSPRTVSRPWEAMLGKLAPLLINHPDEDETAIIQRSHHILFEVDHCNRRKGKYGHDHEALREEIRTLECKGRQTHQHLAAQIGLPLTTTYRLTKGRIIKFQNEGVILYKHSSSLKPTLTDSNKYWRMIYCMAQQSPNPGLTGRKWDGHFDRVHIDEKWFFISRDGKNYLLVTREEPLVRRVQHKKYMTKVMFLCAQARPQQCATTRQMWDGKIGMWPIGYYGVAQRSIHNRPAGTRVWVNETMDHKKYKEMLINCVIPAIAAKWLPSEWNNPNFKIKIQQDGAGGHCHHEDPFLLSSLAELKPNQVLAPGKIIFYTQPANSPDLNICDLGLFNGIQSAYYHSAPKDSIEMIDCVLAAYAQYPVNMINRMFVTLMSVFNCIVLCHGDNAYKLPHMNKDWLEHEGWLPDRLPITSEALIEIMNFGEDPVEDDTFWGLEDVEGAGGVA